jgi:hypothetical protein
MFKSIYKKIEQGAQKYFCILLTLIFARTTNSDCTFPFHKLTVLCGGTRLGKPNSFNN